MQDLLSPIDRKILRLLQHNADLSAAEIAEKVELSQSPCWRRIHRMQEDGVFAKFIAERYAGYRRGMGARILAGKTSLPELEEWAATQGEPGRISGRQEYLENVLNEYIFGES